MIRPDANRIALRATRAILAAAHDFSFELLGKTISVRCTPQAAPSWPHVAEGLDEQSDGPWPSPLTIEARWEGGGSRLTIACEVWSPNGGIRNAVSLSVSITATRRQILWITLATALGQAEDGSTVPILGWVVPGRRHEDENLSAYSGFTAAVRAAVLGAGVPFRTKGNAHIGGIEVPSGDVSPDTGAAFERCVIVAVTKHAWFERRDRSGFEGMPFVDVTATGNKFPVVEPETDKRAGIWPLPGGVRAYMTTLRALVQDINEREPLPLAGLEQLFEERYQATGKTAMKGYRAVLRATGFVAESDGEVSLTDAGNAWLAKPDAVDLFDRLHNTFIGMLELLILAEIAPTLAMSRIRPVLCAVLGTEWKTDNQVAFRRNWLLSLGLTERTASGDAITPAGAEVLAAHADEAAEVRGSIQEALDNPIEGDGGDDSDIESEDDAEASTPGPADAPPSPAPGWFSAQLDLSAQTIGAHLGRLQLDKRLLEQLAAAVSFGKHVLFVGPPGTGKTELAVALTRAATAEGYCAGLFTATASADWTTFDTIGGYAMQKDQTLAFRPGAFLRAIQEQKWLLVDELNRADVDRAFGELMTVLAGQGTDTHYELGDGRRVSIGSEESRTFWVPRSFRVLATMNIWDKTSLFRLSYAVQRRFAIINVGLPDDRVYAAILSAAAEEGALLPPMAPTHLPPVLRLFSQHGLLSLREVGPAVGIDVVSYLRRRGDSADGLAEAIEMFVLPQLQGLSERAAKDARERCEEAVGAAASLHARGSLRARFRELFPGLGASDD